MSNTENKFRSKKDEESIRKLCQLVSSGSTISEACSIVGISVQTLNSWKRTDCEFKDEIAKAEALFKARNLNIIQKAADKSWQAAAWLLERKYQDEFSLKTKITATLNLPDLIRQIEGNGGTELKDDEKDMKQIAGPKEE